jgi:hypothetical protein
MAKFQICRIDVPLFGEVELPNEEAWLHTFASECSKQPDILIEVDESALSIIAEELEIDADYLIAGAERYVSGNFREKARGLSGGQLGEFGEVLTFLLYKSEKQDIVRVVSWKPGSTQTVKGSKFPQPDFIIRKGSNAAALEVKSTEALDFISLRDMTKSYTTLKPCKLVAACREQALPQLAYKGSNRVAQKHSLKIRGHQVVPFPVGQGIAAAVLGVDGRVDRLRSDTKYKTPKSCREAKRSCWSCIPSARHAVIAIMANEPGRLSLGGATADGSIAWFTAYQRWTQALAARDIFAARDAAKVLSDSVINWLETTDGEKRELLASFWGSYLREAMRIRGLNVEVTEKLPMDSDSRTNVDSIESHLAEPENREVEIGEIPRLIKNTKGSLTPFGVSVRLQKRDGISESLSVRASGQFVEFRLASDFWWASKRVETSEEAGKVGNRVITLAMEASGAINLVRIFNEPIPFRDVSARVGDKVIPFGWEANWTVSDSADWLIGLGHWPFLRRPGRPMPWPIHLVTGDPRARMHVFLDGRACIRIHRDLTVGS